MFCSTASEWAENNCNITNSVVIVVALEQLDLVPLYVLRGKPPPRITHVVGCARALFCLSRLLDAAYQRHDSHALVQHASQHSPEKLWL